MDGIWLSPVYRSPMKDFGYDISDYRDIDPVFGNMDDFDRLLHSAHELGLKVMLDMVLNHSSDQHEWFRKSMARQGDETDFYIWRDSVPNNWKACFGGSAWTYSSERGQYYLHSFLKEQPDLNWHDRKCREAVFNEVRYYLDKGVDGFRLDVINLVGKDPELRSNPFMIGETPRPYDMQNHIYDRNTEYTHKYIKELRKVSEQYEDRALLGEIMVQEKGQMEQAVSYLGKDNDELQLAFEFSLTKLSLNARNINNVTRRWYELCSLRNGKTPCWVLSNHDVPRAITRAGNNDMLARLLAMWLIFQRGTSVVYAGEEIAMQSRNVKRSQIQDPVGLKYWPFNAGRDGERRPMQWTEGPNMGFSTVRPWLEPNYTPDWKRRTVEAQDKDPESMLALYRNLIALRKSRPEICMCDPVVISAEAQAQSPGMVAYMFSHGGKSTVVILNFGKRKARFRVDVLGCVPEGLVVALSCNFQRLGLP